MDASEDKREDLDFSEYFDKIIDIPFVKKSFEDLISRKILIDGYVYCNAGLVPNSKNAFKPLESSKSPLYDIIKVKNPDSYREMYEKFISCKIPEQYKLSNLEKQLVLYIIFQLSSPPVIVKILGMLTYYDAKTTFQQYGGFIYRGNISFQEISSLDQFIKYISKFSDVQNLFYRGHSNTNYIAVPSLFREEKFYRNEYVMYQELVIRCPSSFINCSSHLDFLMEMQHYGLPTRLLDVTSNPLVALYFACEDTKNVGEVIVYNIGSQNLKYEKCDEVSILTALPMFEYSTQKSILSDVISGNRAGSASYNAFLSEVKSERPVLSKNITFDNLVTPIFVKPARKNSRILRQEGAFIIWGLNDIYYGDGNQRRSADDQFRYRKASKKTVYYIPSNRKATILKSLNRVGINKAFVYPEIDDVASYIKDWIR